MSVRFAHEFLCRIKHWFFDLCFDKQRIVKVQRWKILDAYGHKILQTLAQQVEVLMLKEIVLIHPLGQVVSLFFGVFNLVTGWTRRYFFLPVHINIGVMFYALTLIGSVVGMMVARRTATHAMSMSSSFHIFIAAGLIAVLTCGVLSGFLLLLKDKGYRTWMLAMHRYCNLFVVVLFVVLAVSGLRVLAAVF